MIALSERKDDAVQMAARAQAAEKALQDFVYAVSHDLGAPLRAVSGFSDIMQQRYARVLDDKGRAYLKFIADGGEQAQRMLAALLAYSRVTTQGKAMARVELGLTLDAVLLGLDEKIETAHARIECGDLPAALGDDTQIALLLTLLLENAMLYVRPGVAPRIVVSATEDETGVMVRVADNGSGLSESERVQAFAPFKRFRNAEGREGTGMGLAIARRIVERHGGEIGIDPSPSGGCEVWFRLPKSVNIGEE